MRQNVWSSNHGTRPSVTMETVVYQECSRISDGCRWVSSELRSVQLFLCVCVWQGNYVWQTHTLSLTFSWVTLLREGAEKLRKSVWASCLVSLTLPKDEAVFTMSDLMTSFSTRTHTQTSSGCVLNWVCESRDYTLYSQFIYAPT